MDPRDLPPHHPDYVAVPASPWRTGLRLLLPLLSIVSLLLVLVATLAGAARWLLATPEGSGWLLQRLPFVQAQGWQGALWGERWQAARLRVTWDGGRQWVDIEGLDAQGLRWQWRPHEHAWLAIDASLLQARKVAVHTGPPSGKPPGLPAEIRPPVQLAVAQAGVGEFELDGKPLMRALQARGFVLDPHPGGRLQADELSFEGWSLAVAGAARLANAQPYALQASASLRPAAEGDSPRWAAVLQAGGTVADLALSGTLRGVPVAGREAPMADLRATLHPLRPWVLGGLDLTTQSLDLSALAARAPATRLSGRASLQGGEGGQPLVATIALDNGLPGRWNEGRLPLSRMALDVQGRLDQPDRVQATRFELQLSDAARPAGTVRGSAVWHGHELTLDTVLAGVTPQRLDSRAAAMTVGGPLSATVRGLPSPAPQAAGAPAPAPAPAPTPSLRWKLDLQGKLDAAPQPVQLAVEGSADDQHLEIQRARAQAGAAVAELKAALRRGARGEWQVGTTGTLVDFDPVPWWPGDAGTAWRKGPHRLSGDWQFDVQLPADAERLAPLALAQRVAGNGLLRIRDSLLAGVPLAAEITLGYTQAAAPTPASLRADLRAGGNQLVLEGRGDPAGGGDSDRWRLELKADQLTALTPLTRLHPALADWVPRQGSAVAVMAADGRWPTMRTEGSARLSQLQMGPLSLVRGTAAWRMASSGEQPLAMQLDLAGVTYGKQRVDNLRADLRGTLEEHRIEISGAAPVLPPPMAEQVLGIQAQSGTRGLMLAQGSWQPDPGGGGRWKARIERVVVGSWDGGAASGPPASGWAEARELKAEFDFAPGGGLAALRADPGRVQFGETAALRWDEVRVDLRGERPRIQLRADLEPFTLAPLLARAQPGFGWQGDLKLAARMDIQAGERMDADVVFERASGDLYVPSGDGTQALGLSEVRFAVTAHDGAWSFTPVFRGRMLGEISGALKVATTPEQRWPAPQSPLSGSVQADVRDLGIWSAWIPAGWRLQGELRTKAGLGGTFGAPQLTGELSGAGLGVRNLLEGVNVTGGQVAVKLEGDTARVEKFTLRSGEGTIEVTGGASGAFGSNLEVALKLKAERFKVLGRVDRQVVASGDAALSLKAEGIRLDGRFRADEALFDATRRDAPSLDDDVTVQRPGMVEEVRKEAAAPKAWRNFAMDVELDLGDNVRVIGGGLDTYLGGRLRMTSPRGLLAVNGTMTAERGTYKGYGQKLDIERGIFAFSGPYNNPRLDILALRPNIDTRVGVSITGNALSPRVRLYSEPDMSEADKLSWLMLGRAPDGLGRADTALLQRAAVALLAGDGEAPTDTLMKTLGIDDISLRSSEGDVRETVISIGKQLSRRWYLGYERGVNATTGTWQLTYRIAQRFTLRAQSGLENALDVIWTWRLQETPADAGMRKSTAVPP